MFANVQITKHARERFVERKYKKFSHLSVCKNNKKKSCPTCVNLTFDLINYAESNKFYIDSEITELFNSSKRIKSIINNSNLLEYYYEKYGYDCNFEYYLNNNILFVSLQEDEKKVIITCIIDKNHAIVKLTSRNNNFKKKKVVNV